MDDVAFDPRRRTVEHRSRGYMVLPSRPLSLLVRQRAMLSALEGTADPKANQIAGMTGALGHLVGVGTRAPPRSWDAELDEMLGPSFEAAHARAKAELDGSAHLAQRLIAMVFGK